MLKIGDIVRIREDLSYDMDVNPSVYLVDSMFEYEGKIGIVVDIDDDKTFKLDVDNEVWWWCEGWVEKLNKFSVGDKVVVCYEEPVGLDGTLPYKLLELLAIMNDLSKPAKYNGKIGIVVSLTENGANIDFVGEEKLIWLPNEWLKKHDRKFKKGDKVRIARSGEDLMACAGGWYSYMKKYVGDVITIGERSYDYGNGIVGYFTEDNCCVWDGRLLEPVIEEKNAEPEYFTGKVVCINDNVRRDITKGKIYNFIDGKALDDAGDRFPCLGSIIHNVDELNDYFKDCIDENAPQFIEIIE